jgi:signal transduction histidine kinase
MTRRTSGTARRLFFAFALLVSIFALGSTVMLVHVRVMRAGLVGLREQVEGVRLALELASAVRDQYAHQAHTIILGNESHLHFYEAAERRVGELTAQVRSHARSPEARAWVDDIEKASAELDEVFRQRIVPAVLKHDQADVQAEHGRAQLLVSRIQDRADSLVHADEASIAAYQAQIGALQTGAFHWTLAFVVLAPVLAVAVGAVVLRSIAGPVSRLHAGAVRLAEGDLDTRIPVERDDEFGALARQFNAMTTALKEHQEKLVQQEKLAGIGRLAAGVAHEINNPLAVILGYARLLAKRADSAGRADLQVIEDETLRAKGIVDGLLDLSRPVAVQPEPVDLRALCDEAVARLAGTPALDGVDVRVSGAGRVRGDGPKLRQVVLNLVRNAAEAAGRGGKVEVEVEDGPEGARLSVSDSGPGLPDDVRARLFEPFFSRKQGGTGLGLAVSKGIVEAHGGRIEAETASLGGARFTVRLPSTALPA